MEKEFIFVLETGDGLQWPISTIKAISKREAVEIIGGQVEKEEDITTSFSLKGIESSDKWESVKLEKEHKKKGWKAFQFINQCKDGEEEIKKPIILFGPDGKRAKSYINAFLMYEK